MLSVEKERKEIESLISSLLISNPNKLTALALDREFWQKVGYPIPFRRYGYASIDSFLRSFSDTLNVQGSGCNATLQVIVDSKVAHTLQPHSYGPEYEANYVPEAPYRVPRQYYEPPKPLYQAPKPLYEAPQEFDGRTFDKKLLKDEKPCNITTLSRREIAHVMVSLVKAGNIDILYLLERSLKKFLINNDTTKLLLQCLKEHCKKINLDISQEIMNDILKHFNDLQLLKTCEFIKTVTKFELPQNEPVSSLPSESFLPSLKTSRSSSLKRNILSPSSPKFVPSKPAPILAQSLIAIPLEPKSSSSVSSEDDTSFVTAPTYKSESNFKQPQSSMYDSDPYSTEPKNKFVFKTKMHGNHVNLITLNGLIYMTIIEMMKVSKLKDTNLETIKMHIGMFDGAHYMRDINLDEHEQLKEELEKSGLVYNDGILSLIRIEFLPEFFQLFTNILFPKHSFKKFICEIYQLYSDVSDV